MVDFPFFAKTYYRGEFGGDIFQDISFPGEQEKL